MYEVEILRELKRIADALEAANEQARIEFNWPKDES